MTSFREVELPRGVSGRLLLHSMPGRCEPLGEVWKQVRVHGVSAIVNLAPDDEVRRKSPEYGNVLAAATVPCQVWRLAVPDFSAPADDAAFAQLVRKIASALRKSKAVMIHCGAGVGRTGTMAVAVLMALGSSPATARRSVKAAGSGPEVRGQEEALRRFEATLMNHSKG
jgi:protein-tyrosine phosphatase